MWTYNEAIGVAQVFSFCLGLLSRNVVDRGSHACNGTAAVCTADLHALLTHFRISTLASAGHFCVASLRL